MQGFALVLRDLARVKADTTFKILYCLSASRLENVSGHAYGGEVASGGQGVGNYVTGEWRESLTAGP